MSGSFDRRFAREVGREQMERPRFVFDFPLGDAARRPVCFGPPRHVLQANVPGEVRRTLREAEACAKDGAWVLGYVLYEAAPAFDAACRAPHAVDLPLAWFAVFDQPLSEPLIPAIHCPGPQAWVPTRERSEYDRGVAEIHSAIQRGDAYQVNFTLRLRAVFAGDDLAWFAHLRQAQASEYCAYLDLGRHRILSASPELFFRRDADVITTRPMKGTAPRGRWTEEDEERREWLYRSAKNRAENVMIVDLLRNDLSRVALPHSVEVPALFDIERYPTLLQMTSTVMGRAREGVGLEEIFAALFPCGSVTGAPKIKAMELIAQLEGEARQVYCGSIGIIAPGGDAVFSVGIRTVLLDGASGQATCGVGGGVVWDSTAHGEYDELLLKSRFLAATVDEFRLFETLRLEDGEYWLLDRHLRRLSRSAAYFGFRYDESACRQLLRAQAAENPVGRRRAKLDLARDGTPRVEIAPFPHPLAEPGLYAVAGEPVSSADPFLFHKTTRRSAYDRARALRPDVFDVLLWNEARQVTEFTRGNIVVHFGGRAVTPPISCGVLDGTLRAEMLERGEIEERIVMLDDLPSASRIWFINSLRGRLLMAGDALTAG